MSVAAQVANADAWIAATALMLDCPLASHDRDFSGIANLALIQATATPPETHLAGLSEILCKRP